MWPAGAGGILPFSNKVGGECGKFESSPEILRKGRHYRRMSCSPLELGLGDFSLEGR